VKQLTVLLLFIIIQPVFSETLTLLKPSELTQLSLQHEVPIMVLTDFVASYNFKCPSEITPLQLKSLLNRLDDDTELSVMVESHRLQWRDIYVEARGLISCLTSGSVSRGY
jgi:hypothetical protein